MKRIVCFLLALVMVLGMIPNTVVTANAASKLSTSASAIEILKDPTTFVSKATGGKIGYNTPASFAGAKEYLDGITTEEAVALLQKYMADEMDKKINEFTETYGLNLSSKQHDALAVHYYRQGGFNANGAFAKAVRTAKTKNEIVAAVVSTRSFNAGQQEELAGILNVALCEAGLYLNGSYSTSGLTYAILDKDGNEKADDTDEVVVFTTAEGYILPVLTDANFMGWYEYDGKVDGKINGAPITKLTGDTEELIVAKKVAKADYTIDTATLNQLHVYTKNDGAKVKGILKYGTDFEVTEEAIVSGKKWVKGTGTDEDGDDITGWVCLDKLTEDKIEDAKPIASATVKSATLPVREGATNNTANEIGNLSKDDVVNIYEIKVEYTSTSGNKNWGKIIYNGGYAWIDLAYTDVEETLGESGSAEGQTGVIANADEVNVRTSAGIGDNLIGKLERGTKVTVLETKMVGTAQWGKIKWNSSVNGYTQGWVYMYYVQLANGPQIDTDSGSAGNGTVKYTGVVTSNINLNVRKHADIYSTKVDSLPTGSKINIYETKTKNNMKWGRIGENRWVCLAYVALTEVAQPEGGAGSESTTTTTVQATVTKVATLDVYKNYNSNSGKVGSLKKGDVVTILERNSETTSTGTRIWGRISTDEVSGWINLAYTEVKTVTTVTGGSENSTSGVTSNSNGAAGTVANCISVNIREGAGVTKKQITKLNNGTSVKVYERVTKDGAPWARITWNNGANEGWVCMNYIAMNTQSGGTAADGTVGGTNSNTISATGIVNSNIDLKVRSGAGLGNAQIGSLKKGTKVTVYEQMSADGMIWGRIPYGAGSGWICMSYVTIESTTTTGKGVMGTVARCFAAVNVRSAPGTNNALINKINVGSRVEVFETRQHGTMLWGRVAQGWVCMDYILLDSELPPGTVLDATVPTTEATQPGATTSPEDDVIVEGAVKYAFTVTPGDDMNIYNDADDESMKVGSVSGSTKIQGIKMNGKELWGLIDQYGTAGWLNLTKATYTISGYVNTDDQAVYADNFSTVKGTLSINKALTINKVTTDGSKVYGWVEENIFGWIPMAKVSEKEVENVTTVYRNGDTVGSGEALIGKSYEALDAVESIGSSKVIFKMESGVTVKATAIRFDGAKIWGLVTATEGTGWVNMGKTNYSLSVTGADLEVRSTMDDSTKATDEKNNIIGTTDASFSICQMQYDIKGNVWAVITGATGEKAELNGNYVMIRTSGTENLVGGLIIG